ncbi:MAG: hypothetical protein NTW37_04075, partial [Proteobacteria bacterium]|nr:hypothetical protein [Pseudomonadota bacterium]
SGSSDILWRLISPTGEQLWAPGSFNDVAERTYTQAGSYLLLVEGRYYSIQPNAYSFSVISNGNTPIEPVVGVALTLDQLVSGNRASSAQVDLYTFTLAQPTRVMMDPRTDNGSLRWTITGERGTMGSLTFQQRSWDLSSNSVVSLDAGAYTLRVDGNTTGAYGFRLLDLSAATVFTPGIVQSVTLNPGNSTVLRAFDVAAGDRMYIDALSATTTDSTWRLIDSDGQQRWLNGLGTDTDTLTFDRAGRYVLAIEGRRYQTTANTFTFNVQPSPRTTRDITFGQSFGVEPRWVGGAPALGAGGALAIDTVGEIRVPDGVDTDLRGDVTFEAWIRPDRYPTTWTPIAIKGDAAYNRSYSMSLHNNGYLSWGTRDPSGDQYIPSATGSIQLGRWTHVAGVIDRTGGTPQLRLYIDGVLAGSAGVRPAQAIGVSEPLRIGAMADERSDYDRFDGAIDEVRLWNVARTETQIAASRDLALAGPQAGLTVRLALDEGSGTVAANSSGSGGPNGSVRHLYDGLTGTIAGTLAVAGQTDQYRFTLTGSRRIAVDVLTNAYGVVTWTLSGPGGVVDSRNFNSTDSSDRYPVYDLAAGTYTLSIDGNGEGMSAYGLRLLDLSTASSIASGVAVTATLRPGSETELYRFAATAGERYFFDVLSSTVSDGRIRLVSPTGRLAWESGLSSDVDAFTLAETGAYTLLVEGRRNYSMLSQTVRFMLVSAPDTTRDIAFGESVGVQVGTVAGATAGLGQAIALDGLGRVELPDGLATDLRGSVTVEAWINPARFPNTWMPLVVKDTAVGLQRTYSLWLNADGSLYGDSQDIAGLHTGRTAAGAVALGRWTHVALVIDRNLGSQGVRLFVDGVNATATTSNGPPIPAQLAVATGRPLLIGTASEKRSDYSTFDGAIDDLRIWSVARSAAQIAAGRNGPLTGAEAGLSVYLPMDAIAAGSTPNLVAGSPAGSVIHAFAGLDGTLAGEIGVPGQTDRYRFTLAERRLVAFDALNNAYGVLSWRLTGPAGFDVTRNFNATDANSGYPVFDLAPGTYTLSIDGSGDGTSPYGLRLVDLAGLPMLTPGTEVSGTLTPASRTDGWRFSGTAGALFMLDQQPHGLNSTSPYAAWVRLISPFGTQVWAAWLAEDVDTFELPFDGTYTVLVEGLRDQIDQTPNVYSFNLQSATPEQRVLELGQAQRGEGSLYDALPDVIEGRIATPGQRVEYTLDLASTRRVVFDALSDVNFTWSL